MSSTAFHYDPYDWSSAVVCVAATNSDRPQLWSRPSTASISGLTTTSDAPSTSTLTQHRPRPGTPYPQQELPFDEEEPRPPADQVVLPSSAASVDLTSSAGSTRSSVRSCRLPRGTLHRDLKRKVSFIPYPTAPFSRPYGPQMPKSAMVRIFLGQLPYQVTDMQLDWLCYTFGGGSAVFFPERIVKKDAARGMRIPTGCIHAYCHPRDAEAVMSMHKRLLIDDTGVWAAESEPELDVLTRYCQAMKADRSLRYHNRPYDTVTAQPAVSRYHPSSAERQRTPTPPAEGTYYRPRY